MIEESNDPFDFTKLLKSSSITLGFIYVYISVLGFLYLLTQYSGFGINLFNYYELTDFLLIGIINYKVLIITVSIILIFNALLTSTFRHFIRKYRKPAYGQDFDDDSKIWFLKLSKGESISALLVRLPVIILLTLSILQYHSPNEGLFILFFIFGVLYYLILVAVLALLNREVLLDESGIKILLYIVMIIGLCSGIILGYIDRNTTIQNNPVIVKTEKEVFKSNLIGTSKNHIFLHDSTIHVLNRGLVQSIEYQKSINESKKKANAKETVNIIDSIRTTNPNTKIQ
jgi:hypothetical protein